MTEEARHPPAPTHPSPREESYLGDKDRVVYARMAEWTPEQVLCLMQGINPASVDFDSSRTWEQLSDAYDALTEIRRVVDHPAFRSYCQTFFADKLPRMDAFSAAWMKKPIPVSVWLRMFQESKVSFPADLTIEAQASITRAKQKWPWGDYENPRLELMHRAIEEFITEGDDTYPPKNEVVTWLMGQKIDNNQKVTNDLAEKMETIISPRTYAPHRQKYHP